VGLAGANAHEVGAVGRSRTLERAAGACAAAQTPAGGDVNADAPIALPINT